MTEIRTNSFQQFTAAVAEATASGRVVTIIAPSGDVAVFRAEVEEAET